MKKYKFKYVFWTELDMNIKKTQAHIYHIYSASGSETFIRHKT